MIKLTTALPKSLGIWHFINAFLILLLLLTVLLVKVLFAQKIVMPELISVSATKGLPMSVTDMRTIMKLYSHKIWNWHTFLGYVLCAFSLYRAIIALRKKNSGGYFAKRKELIGMKSAGGISTQTFKHLSFVQMLYALFYSLLAIMCFTGLVIVFTDDIESLKTIRKGFKKVHEIGMYSILAFIMVHIVGFLRLWVKQVRKQNAIEA